MRLKSIRIVNYRSVDELSFDIAQLEDKSCTHGLIGVNEVGKSTILKALALKDGLKDAKGDSLPLKKDFKDKNKPIEIDYFYTLDKKELAQTKELLNSQTPPIVIEEGDLKEVNDKFLFNFINPGKLENIIEVVNIPEEQENKTIVQELIKKIVSPKIHKAVFWTAEDRYIISQPINLAQFGENPDAVSVPLKNCFLLTGIVDIKSRINSLVGDSTEVEQLENELGSKVTSHINSVWPKHPIEITFKIGEGLINFHVKDLGAKGKAKTADQRSDGFRQFVSFLLTISAQSRNNELSNSILLLDEPETHLHPQAQEDLLKELINITQNDKDNIVFFATHSNYMIDKDNLSRNYKITKEKDISEKKQFDKKFSTYASVTFEVFDIASTDYHNELYSKLHQRYQGKDANDEEREKIKNFDKNFFQVEKKLKLDKPWKGTPNTATFPTYIRNCIHHSVNGNKFSDEDLRKSIELLRSYDI